MVILPYFPRLKPGTCVPVSAGCSLSAPAGYIFVCMEHIGLVGLPNSGKTSLFNAATGSNALTGRHPFTTTESAVGIAHVPDSRLDALATMSNSRKVVYTGVELADIAGLVKGSSEGSGLGNRFLAGIREVDALCMVLRAFDDPEIPGEADPVEALSILEIELAMADLASLEVQLERRRKSLKSKKPDNATEAEITAMEEAYEFLSSGVPLYRSIPNDDLLKGVVSAGLSGGVVSAGSSSQEKNSPATAAINAREARRGMFLLTDKPMFCVINIGEGDIGNSSEMVDRVQTYLGGSGNVVAVCVQLEMEAAQLPPDERAEMLEGLGLGEVALSMVAHQAYAMLNRWTFLTTGDKESRAWSFRAGSTAPECAGVIHSDLQRGFIRAEVVNWKVLLDAGSWSNARHNGLIRLEGKDYLVQDGDVIEVRFNV